MKTSLYNLKGETIGEVDLPEKIFGSEWNPDLVHQVLMAQAANRRSPWAHAKGRGEVRGGGVKPGSKSTPAEPAWIHLALQSGRAAVFLWTEKGS